MICAICCSKINSMSNCMTEKVNKEIFIYCKKCSKIIRSEMVKEKEVRDGRVFSSCRKESDC